MCQSSFLKITCGADTCSSKPSLLIVSMRTERCSSPLPETLHLFPSFEKSISNPTFVSSSLCSLSIIFLEVTSLPSRPAKGESFTRKSIVSVGASTLIGGNGSAPGTQTVSPTKISGIPAIVAISPQVASFVSILERPSVVYSFAIFPFLWTPSLLKIMTSCPCFTFPS